MTMTIASSPSRPIGGIKPNAAANRLSHAAENRSGSRAVSSAGAPAERAPDEVIATPRNLADYLSANAAALAHAAGGKVDADRVIHLCARLIENPRNADLRRCTLRSFAAALFDCLAMGIYPDTGRGYFIASGDRAVFLLGYQGMIELASKAGIFVKAYNVFKGDRFKWVAGGNERIVHLPNIEIRRSEETFLCSYCVSIVDGHATFDVMLKNEIDAVRDRAGELNTVWSTDYLEMARKTVVRRAAKFWPIRFESGAVRPFDWGFGAEEN
ncbi:MAG: recombinase RecT [Thermoguttaceae bacterium]|nr:recombinase RecT [Thermoguttaceae bacterium]